MAKETHGRVRLQRSPRQACRGLAGARRGLAGARRQGMTLAELALGLGVLGIGLALVSGAIRHVRDEAKAEQTRRFLVRLDEAVGVYHERHGAFPPGQLDPGTADCLAAVKEDREAWGALAGTSPLLLARPAGKSTYFQDGWGTPLRYLTAAGPRYVRNRVATNGGRPIFASAGPDRDFGDRDPAALTDNLATDHLDVR